jgi:hypothetical protein
MNARVEFDVPSGAGPPKQSTELLDHRQRRQIVVLGAGCAEPLTLPNERCGLFSDERLHLVVLGRDVQRLFDHGRVSSHNPARTVEGLDGSW